MQTINARSAPVSGITPIGTIEATQTDVGIAEDAPAAELVQHVKSPVQSDGVVLGQLGKVLVEGFGGHRDVAVAGGDGQEKLVDLICGNSWRRVWFERQCEISRVGYGE